MPRHTVHPTPMPVQDEQVAQVKAWKERSMGIARSGAGGGYDDVDANQRQTLESGNIYNVSAEDSHKLATEERERAHGYTKEERIAAQHATITHAADAVAINRMNGNRQQPQQRPQRKLYKPLTENYGSPNPIDVLGANVSIVPRFTPRILPFESHVFSGERAVGLISNYQQSGALPNVHFFKRTYGGHYKYNPTLDALITRREKNESYQRRFGDLPR